MTNDDDKDALEAAKKARWETGEWCGDSVEQFEAGWYAHHDMTKGGPPAPPVTERASPTRLLRAKRPC
jgi:hypothetical protein